MHLYVLSISFMDQGLSTFIHHPSPSFDYHIVQQYWIYQDEALKYHIYLSIIMWWSQASVAHDVFHHRLSHYFTIYKILLFWKVYWINKLTFHNDSFRKFWLLHHDYSLWKRSLVFLDLHNYLNKLYLLLDYTNWAELIWAPHWIR